MTKILSKCLALSLGALCFHINAQVINLGAEVHPDDVSDYGVVTGSLGESYFKWDTQNGLQNIGSVTNGYPLSGKASISADGKKISATITNPDNNMNEMALYDDATQNWSFLGGLSGNSDLSKSTSQGISSDGKTVVGLGWTNVSTAHPVKWTQESGIFDLGSTVTGRSARANSVNKDGSVIAGWQDTESGMWSAAVWKNGVQTLISEETEYGTLPLQELTAISDDGIWAVGSSVLGYATIWSEATGIKKIEHPDVSLETGFAGAATGVNENGTMVVGYFRNIFVNPAPDSGEGFIWTPATGRVELTAYAQSLGIDTQGIKFNLPMGISPNGKYITGWGVKDNTSYIGFRLELPAQSLAANSNSKKQISIYPNPVDDFLNIKGAHKISDLELYDSTGRKVNVTLQQNNQLNVSKLPKGIYVLKGLFDNKMKSIKIIKK